MLKIDHDTTSIVLRAFGPGAEPLTSRPREIATHSMFAAHGLAPPLLARFKNGLVYSFAAGKPCDLDMMSEERVWRGVARNLARWHATLPIGAAGTKIDAGDKATEVPTEGQSDGSKVGKDIVEEIRKDETEGDMWSVLRMWASRIPESDPKIVQLKSVLKSEVESTFKSLSSIPSLAGQTLVMGHCDLLCGNILITDDDNDRKTDIAKIQFIDYEYSVACHPAFDISLYFGEWPGFDCDYTRIPSPETRREFVREYVRSYRFHSSRGNDKSNNNDNDKENDDDGDDGDDNNDEDQDEQGQTSALQDLIDTYFRGLPGLWFGLWGLVQIEDSSEEFDYGAYAAMRLEEYWAWKKGFQGEEGMKKDGDRNENEKGVEYEDGYIKGVMDMLLGKGNGEGKSDIRLRERLWFGGEKKGERA